MYFVKQIVYGSSFSSHNIAIVLTRNLDSTPVLISHTVSDHNDYSLTTEPVPQKCLLFAISLFYDFSIFNILKGQEFAPDIY